MSSEARDDAAARAVVADMFRRRNARIARAIESVFSVWSVKGKPDSRHAELTSIDPEDLEVWTAEVVPSVPFEEGDLVVVSEIADRQRVIFNLSRSGSGDLHPLVIEQFAITVHESPLYLDFESSFFDVGVSAFDPNRVYVNTDYTAISEHIRDTIAAFVVAGTNMTVTHNDASNTLTLASAGGGGATWPVSDATFQLSDNSDATKKLMFDLANVLTASTVTLSVPSGLSGGHQLVLLGATQSLLNKTLGISNILTIRDDRFTLQDDADNTKQGVFDLSLVATGQTRTYTLPATSGQLLSESGAQNINSKTFGSGNSASGMTTFTTQADDEFVIVTDNNPNLGKMSWPTFITQLRTAGANALNGAYQPLDADLTTIAGLVDPNADRILFWDDSAGAYAYLTIGSNLSITGTTLDATGGGGGGAPTTATYITQTPDSGLSSEQALSTLPTGVVKVTTGTGLLSTATAADIPLDSDLAAIAALAPSNDDIIQRKSGVWTNRTVAQFKTDLALEGALSFSIDGEGSILATGARGNIILPYNCVPTEWIILNDVNATVGIELWKDTLANFPPVSGDNVTGSSTQRLRTTAARTGNSSTLTGWTTSGWNKRDIITVNIAANDLAKKIEGIVFLTRT